MAKRKTKRARSGKPERGRRNPTPIPTPRKGKKDWAAKFLAELARTGNVSVAAKAAGVHRDTAYEHKTKNPQFARFWASAVEYATDALIEEARRRGQDGVAEPVFFAGKHVGIIRRYSDNLLKFLIQAKRPEYRDTIRQEHSGPGGGPIAVQDMDKLRRQRWKQAMPAIAGAQKDDE